MHAAALTSGASASGLAGSRPGGSSAAVTTAVHKPARAVAALPRCRARHVTALQTSGSKMPDSVDQRQQRQQQLVQQQWRWQQQRAALLACRAAGPDSSGSWPAQQQPAVAPASTALVLSSSDDEPVPPYAAGSSSGENLSSDKQAASAGQAPDSTGSTDEAVSSSIDNDSGSESGSDGTVRIDLQLPRRSLLVQFTCNICGGRSERLVNPIAWEKGMVIAQCQHCPSWHKLADAANLVEEIHYADLEDE